MEVRGVDGGHQRASRGGHAGLRQRRSPVRADVPDPGERGAGRGQAHPAGPVGRLGTGVPQLAMRAVVNPAWVASQKQVPAAGVPSAPSQVTSITVDGGATVSWGNPGSGPAATSYTVTPYIAGAVQAATTVTA